MSEPELAPPPLPLDAHLPAQPPPVPPPPERAWPLGLLFGFLNFFVIILFTAPFARFPFAGCVIPVGILGGEALIGYSLSRRGEVKFGRALMLAPLFTLAITVALGALAFGICLIAIGSDGLNFQ